MTLGGRTLTNAIESLLFLKLLAGQALQPPLCGPGEAAQPEQPGGGHRGHRCAAFRERGMRSVWATAGSCQVMPAGTKARGNTSHRKDAASKGKNGGWSGVPVCANPRPRPPRRTATAKRAGLVLPPGAALRPKARAGG